MTPGKIICVLIAILSADIIQLEETVSGTLDSAKATKEFLFTPTESESVTIGLESPDFNAFLTLLDAKGKTLAQDDDGGIVTNARLFLEAEKGKTYLIRVSTKKSKSGGSFELWVESGTYRKPTGEKLARQQALFHGEAGNSCKSRGDLLGGISHREREGHLWMRLSQFPKAQKAYEKCLDLAKELNHQDEIADAHHNLGRIARRRGKFSKAREHYESSLEINRRNGDREGEAGALSGLGTLFLSLGQFQEAREVLKQAIILYRDSQNETAEARALTNLGNALESLGEYQEARDHFEKALTIKRKFDDPTDLANTLVNLALVHRKLGNLSGSRDMYRETLDIYRKFGNREGEAASLVGLGQILIQLQDYEEAKTIFLETLDLVRQMNHKRGEAITLNNLGIAHEYSGDYSQAVFYYEKSLSLQKSLGNQVESSSTLTNLGNVHRILGHYTKSREYIDLALNLARKGGLKLQEAQALNISGLLHLEQEQWKEAVKNCQLALNQFRQLEYSEGIASALLNLGTGHLSLEEFEHANQRYGEALEIAQSLNHRVLQINSLLGQGKVLLKQNHPDSAREKALSAHKIAQEVEEKETQLSTLELLVRSSLAKKNWEDSGRYLEMARILLDRPDILSLGIGGSSGYRSRYSFWGKFLQDYVFSRYQHGNSEHFANLGFRQAGRWKGRALLEGIVEHVRGDRPQELIQLRKERDGLLRLRESALEEIGNGLRQKISSREVDRLRKKAEDLAKKIHKINSKIRKISPRDVVPTFPGSVEPHRVRTAILGDKQILVEFVEGEKSLYAYVLSAEKLFLLKLGPLESLLEKVESFQKSLRSPGTKENQAQDLYRSLIQPVIDQEKKTIKGFVLIPCASLAGLPFEALHDGKQFLLERFEIFYAPSSPVIVELFQQGPRRAQGKALILADPIYPGEEPRSGDLEDLEALRSIPAPDRLPRLKKTRTEALGVAYHLLEGKEANHSEWRQLKTSTRSGSFTGKRVEVFLGAEASSRRLEGDLKSYRILHLAAHGFVDREFPGGSGIALSRDAGDGDFFVTISDVLDLDLDADLVVLSACDTAQGPVKFGEGIESLARAFLYAGSRGVMASLWQVGDRATAITMEEFYRAFLKKGLPPAKALRQAKLILLRQKPFPGAGDPVNWAPFIYIGL